MTELVPLPPQPSDVPWPAAGGAWPEGEAPAAWGLEALVDELFADPGCGVTYGLGVLHRGRKVAERFDGEIEHWDRPNDPVGPTTRLLSWSVAKSLLHMAVGVLVDEGRLDPASPAPVPGWSSADDPRRAITLDHLLTMRDGLDWVEDYDPSSGRSDVIEMLFGGEASGMRPDVAAFAADRPPAAPPGGRYLYSSGTTNIVSGIVARTVGPGERYQAWLRRVLFDPIGADPVLRFDAAGTWVASSYAYLSLDDWLRLGLLALRGGTWGGRQVIPAGWLDHGRRLRSPDEGLAPFGHGAHWWTNGDALGTFSGEGYEGQWLLVVPALDVVVARFGKTPPGRRSVLAWVERLLDHLAADDGLMR